MGGSGYASSGSDKEDEDPSMVTQSAARGNRDMGVRMVTQMVTQLVRINNSASLWVSQEDRHQ